MQSFEMLYYYFYRVKILSVNTDDTDPFFSLIPTSFNKAVVSC